MLLTVCVAFGALAALLKQPLIVGFLIGGIVVGPQVTGLVGESEQVLLLATVGIALLLFVVGLKLDIGLIRRVGPVALVAGLGQVAATGAIGFLLALLLGIQTVPAIYVAIALAFSSTVIVVKLLSDKRETADLHGRIAIGILIVQDLLVIFAMIGLNAFGGLEERGVAQGVAILLRGGLFLVGLGAIMRWVLPSLLHRMAHNPELMMLFAIAWAVALGAAGEALGFSVEAGAFLAGVSLASTPYRDAIGNRLTSVRDFLIVFFFIELGILLDISNALEQIGPAIALSLFVLVGKPLLVTAIMGRMGYPKRVSFLTGVTLGQISEFSLILAALGVSLGQIDGSTLGLITAVGLITIGSSAYVIDKSHWIYGRLSGPLGIFERRRVVKPDEFDLDLRPEIIVFGLGRFGGALMERLVESGIDVLGLDIDPATMRRRTAQGFRVIYGDAEDPEVPASLPLANVRWIVSTLRRNDANIALMQALRHRGYQEGFAAAADGQRASAALHDAGVTTVLLPFQDAAAEAADILTRDLPERDIQAL